ncbi:5336_t:CDS:2, partial [Cetraspora pellucida]
IMQAKYARVLLEIVDHLEESNDLTLSLNANNLLIAIETSLKNINLDFNKIIALVTDSPSVMHLSYEAKALKTLALKIFAIRPHAAEVEQLFSSMAVEASKKVENNQVSNNTDEDTNFVELEDYDTLFTSSSNTNDDIEWKSELQEIYTEFENSSDLFLEQLVNFDVEELTLESINKKNITRAKITS